VLALAVDHEVSIGDYVLSGGELPALVLIDALARLQPVRLGDERSSVQESFEHGLLDCRITTRPEVFEGRRRAGGAQFGRSRCDRALAAQAERGANVAAAPGTDRSARRLMRAQCAAGGIFIGAARRRVMLSEETTMSNIIRTLEPSV